MQIEIPPLSARAVEVKQGQRLRVTDVAGGQPGDLVAFNLHDMGERFSQTRTRVELRRCSAGVGDALWSNVNPPRILLKIVDGSPDRHDLLYAPCCRYALKTRFGVERDGCLENLATALAPYGVEERDVPDPLNLFFSVDITSAGEISIGEHGSSSGAFIELQAETDLLFAVSTCAAPQQNRSNTGYLLALLDG